MHFTRILLPCAVLVAATACSSVTRTSGRQPAPQNSRTTASGGSTAATLKIPPGHLPAPGECRVWIPGVPPGQQKAHGGNGQGNGKGKGKGKGKRNAYSPGESCRGIEDDAPLGSWIVYRPGSDKKVVQVKEMHDERPGVIVRVNTFDIATRQLVRGG